ncbi:hypothetical protein SUGI_0018030 [Cryptomeria japonica]|uniref:TLC domain-containing protein At5g14285 n=1 Tax=Cryptomeria japonica TaxID=3369 RepID=UPI002408DABC|nr:TLC domain-containing protein At5g14285 [Cryptomeria japonica]GLJ05425.1 hypothetical protein SUGI_0018030 [Cryptomeria japonica]
MFGLAGAVAFFITQYSLAYFILFRKYRKPERWEAASCTISMAHGPLVTVLAAYDIAVSKWQLDAPNTGLERAVMEYSIAYFMVDLFHYLLFVPGKLLFVAHHLATAFVMASCRFYAGHGAQALMALLCVAEITSACQNTWSLSMFAMHVEPTRARRIHEAVCVPFYVLYSVARGIVAPLLAWRLSCFYLGGRADGVMPRWLVQCWMGIVVLAILASVLWVVDLWVEFFRACRKKNSVKVC